MSSEEKDNPKWVLGIILGLLGSIAINTGNNIQALGIKSLKDNSAISVDSKHQVEAPPSVFHSRAWILGTIIFVGGSLINFTSFAFAAQSLLASLQSVQFITNLFLGKFLLKASITNKMLTGTFLTVIGTCIAVQFSSKTVLELNIDEMVTLYKNPVYIVYLVLMVSFSIVLHLMYQHFENKKKEMNPIRYSEVLLPLSYSLSSAMIGTQSVVHAKVIAELLAAQMTGSENVFNSKFTYLAIMFWFLSALFWLKRLNRAIGTFNPMLIIPLLQCSFIFFSILSGGIYFKEFHGFTKSQWIGFWSGIFTMFCGLVLLTPRNDKVGNGESPFFISSKNESAEEDRKYSPLKYKGNVMGNDVKQTASPVDLKIEMSPRRFRQSSDRTDAAFTHLKETLVETTKVLVTQTTLFLASPTTAISLTNVMVDATKQQTKQHHIRVLREILKESELDPENLYSNESLVILQELDIVPKHVRCLREHVNQDPNVFETLRSRICTTIEESDIPESFVVKEIV
jgi:uncharacterized membrane protein